MQATSVTPQTVSNEVDVSRIVVETIADAEGVEPTDMEERLYDVIDPDALNSLFRQEETGRTSAATVSFEFHGYEVTVHGDSSVELSETTF
ncbi:MAG: HalOD1 output domain-containing protein [Halapricum sp.]